LHLPRAVSPLRAQPAIKSLEREKPRFSREKDGAGVKWSCKFLARLRVLQI
jgi:hypothetical protein